MSDSQLRVLVLNGDASNEHPVSQWLGEHCHVDVCASIDAAMQTLGQGNYDAVFADVGGFLTLERGLVGSQAALVLDTIGEGVCVIEAEGACSWSNRCMRQFSPDILEKVIGVCQQARSMFIAQLSGLDSSSPPRSKKFTFQNNDDRFFELVISPVIDADGQVSQIVAVAWDATSGKRLQQKLNAIDAAGRALARIDRDAIRDLTPDQRLQLLRDKIISSSRDLMHFDHFAIRLVDKRSNKLEVVIAEGLPPKAIDIELDVQPEGNGISGYVAATGRSYICHDTEKDARYVIGIEHCKSSLTVPLRLHDQIIGVFNIESDQIGFFNEDDRQFAEIFGRYVAMALNMLDVLVVERYTSTGQLANSVVQEMAQPLNDIMTDAQALIEHAGGDEMMRDRLNQIVDNVEVIRRAVQDVAAGPKAILGSRQVQVPEHESPLAGKRILVADDELNIRKTIGEVLGKLGCHCTLCKDGSEAVNMLDNEAFDLLISDIKMPHRNGYEIFAAARRRQESVPVILMTGFGYDPNHSIVRASREGLSTVLFKPFKVDQILDEIHKALDLPPPPQPNQPTAS
jgi:CheY-like chemotaxis protein